MHQKDKLHKPDLHIYCGNFASDTATNYTSLIYLIIMDISNGKMYQIDKIHEPCLDNYYGNLHNYCDNFYTQ